MAEIIDLLERFWILKEQDKELYYYYKNLDRETKDFVREKLGYNLIINQHLVKLEKIPESPKPWMGVKSFSEATDYVFLCILLSFIEDKGRDEQFLLSHITEYIFINYPIGDLDWTQYTKRKSLVRVLNFALQMGFIKIDDGNQEIFSDNYETEVLYESTGLSRYFIRNFIQEYTGFNSYEEILKAECFTVGENDGLPSGALKRTAAYRALMLENVLYNKEDGLFSYIRNKRGILQSDFEKYMAGELNIYKDCAYLVVEDNRYREAFPEDKNICDISLMLLGEIRSLVDNGELILNADDTLFLETDRFNDIFEACNQEYREMWNKEYRSKSGDLIKKELIDYLSGCNMLVILPGGYRLLPLAIRFTGYYIRDISEQDLEKHSDLSVKEGEENGE